MILINEGSDDSDEGVRMDEQRSSQPQSFVAHFISQMNTLNS